MNLIRYYNQNRKKIWGILIIIFSAFILLQLVNYIYKINNGNKSIAVNNTKSEINTNTTVLTTNKSVVTGESVSSEQLQSDTVIIDNFLYYCNNKELQKAYDLLTDECKKQMYNTLEVFKQAYYDDVFEGKNKTTTVENWINNTYKVKITDDILATGRSSNGYSKQDYITVVKVDDEYKLNINNYVGYMQINKTTNQDDISMKVVSKNTYMEYEEYTINVTNNTNGSILLDSKTDVNSLYLQDSKKVKYSFYGHELTEPMLTIASGQTKVVTIKFYSSYVSTKTIKYVIFSDLSLNDSQGQISKKIEFKANI